MHGTRAERHGGHATWLWRFHAAGFQPAMRRTWTVQISVPVITVSATDDHVEIGHGGVGIVAVLCGQA